MYICVYKIFVGVSVYHTYVCMCAGICIHVYLYIRAYVYNVQIHTYFNVFLVISEAKLHEKMLLVYS